MRQLIADVIRAQTIEDGGLFRVRSIMGIMALGAIIGLTADGTIPPEPMIAIGTAFPTAYITARAIKDK